MGDCHDYQNTLGADNYDAEGFQSNRLPLIIIPYFPLITTWNSNETRGTSACKHVRIKNISSHTKYVQIVIGKSLCNVDVLFPFCFVNALYESVFKISCSFATFSSFHPCHQLFFTPNPHIKLSGKQKAPSLLNS